MSSPATVHVTFGLATLAFVGLGVAWSSWYLVAAGVCTSSAWAWRVTRL